MKYSFVESGFCEVGPIYGAAECSALMKEIRLRRNFDDLFLDESEYRANPRHVGVNPRPGRNLLDKLENAFIFDNPIFQERMTKALGDRWQILDCKLVMGVPDSWMPDWLLKETKGLAVANLGPYVRPKHRDITYFHGIDFHQDIIDFKDRPADFVTAYVYLENTDENTSPLYVVPGSHKFGATVFPHKLEEAGGKLRYSSEDGRRCGAFEKLMLTGPQGTLYFWHALTLHGTKPHQATEPRISVRMLVEKGRRCPLECELDRLNEAVDGPLQLSSTRKDLNASGVAQVRGNVINEIKR